MTELMKRHIEEGGDCKIAVYVSCALPNVKRYIEWLEAQLTWRPASEKPKDGQIVFAMIPTGWVVSQYLHGKFYIEDAYMGYMHLMVHKNSNPELLGGK